MNNKVLIYATTRSASKYLRYCIAKSSNLTMLTPGVDMGAVYEMDLDSQERFLEERFSPMKETDDFIVMDHPYHVAPIDTSIVMEHYINEYLANINYVIALTRKDVVSRTMSLALMYATEWMTPYNDQSLNLSHSHVLNACENVVFSLEQFVENKRNLKINELCYYEDLTFDPNVDFHNLALSKQLSNEQKPHEETFKAPDKKTIIINYDEVYENVSNYFKDITNERFQIKDGMIVALNNEHWMDNETK